MTGRPEKMLEKNENSFDTLFECIPDPGTAKHSLLLDFCKTNHSYVLASLPFIAAEIAEFCGYYAFFELIREFGGSKINIAGGPEMLVNRYGISISDTDYKKLQHHVACDWVDLPSAWGVFVALRRTAIMSEVTQSHIPPPSQTKLNRATLNRTLAQKYGVSERYVRKLARSIPVTTSPLSFPHSRGNSAP